MPTHEDVRFRGVKRTSLVRSLMSANDPKWTLSCILVFSYNWTTIRLRRSH